MTTAPPVTLFDEVGRSIKEHQSDVFAKGTKNNVESEVTSVAAEGVKMSFTAKRNEDGTILAFFKPTYAGITTGSVNAELKAQVGTDNSSRLDVSVKTRALSGLKIKGGTNGKSFQAAAEYISRCLATNLKLNYNLCPEKENSFEAAGSYHHGPYIVGGKFKYPFNSVPELEGKLGYALSKECYFLGSAKNNLVDTNLSMGYFHKLTSDRTISAELNFTASGKEPIKDMGLSLASSHKLSEDTTFKAKFSTSDKAFGFGVVQGLTNHVSVEIGANLKATMEADPVYNFKVVYKA